MKRIGIVFVFLIGCWIMPLLGARGQGGAPPRETLPPPTPPREQLPVPSDLPPPTPIPVPAPDGFDAPAGSSCCRTLSVPRLTLMEEQKAVPVSKLNLRPVLIGEARGLDVENRPAPQIICEWSLQPRQVIQLVPCTTMVPETVTDPCTGKCRTEYRACPTVREVKITVFDKVPVQRAVVVSVPCLKPGAPVLVQKLAVDCTLEPAILSRFQLLTMPNQVQVPACPACPTLPPVMPAGQDVP